MSKEGNFARLVAAGLLTLTLAEAIHGKSHAAEATSVPFPQSEPFIPTKAQIPENTQTSSTERFHTFPEVPFFTKVTTSYNGLPDPEDISLPPKTYNSAKDAFDAIQKGGSDGQKGSCMTYPAWPGRMDAWQEAVTNLLNNHSDINYVDGSGGLGGAARTYDGTGYCLVMFLPVIDVTGKDGGVLIYEAIGATGPETKYVRFDGAYDASVYPPPKG